MTHSEMDDLYELYVLGVLEPELSSEIEQHLQDGCERCIAGIGTAVRVTTSMAALAEPKTPPATLRNRVLCSVKHRSDTMQRRIAWLVPILAAACITLAVIAVRSGSELSQIQKQLAVIRNERNELRSALEILTRSDTRAVQFGRAESLPHGRVLISRTGGLVFVASQLPRLPQNSSYELWLILNSGPARPEGVFKPDAEGDSVRVSPFAADPAQVKAIAVSVEPERGSPALTTTPILVVPVS